MVIIIIFLNLFTGAVSFPEVRKAIEAIISGRILVGHNIEQNDLRVSV